MARQSMCSLDLTPAKPKNMHTRYYIQIYTVRLKIMNTSQAKDYAHQKTQVALTNWRRTLAMQSSVRSRPQIVLRSCARPFQDSATINLYINCLYKPQSVSSVNHTDIGHPLTEAQSCQCRFVPSHLTVGPANYKLLSAIS